MHIRETNGLKEGSASIVRLLQKAAGNDFPEACRTLAIAYEYGFHDLLIDFERAPHYNKKAEHNIRLSKAYDKGDLGLNKVP